LFGNKGFVVVVVVVVIQTWYLKTSQGLLPTLPNADGCDNITI
jgi:hypothetical protein